MARPTINDDHHILEVAIVLQENSGMKFSQALRLAKPRMGEIENYQSEDSFRRRLQRKFNKDQVYWQSRADEEMRERYRQQIEQGIEDVRRFVSGVAENMVPAVKGINAIARSPAMLEFFETAQRVEKQMAAVRMPAIKAMECVQRKHDMIMKAMERVQRRHDMIMKAIPRHLR